MAYSVAKNTGFLTTASVAQRVVSFVYFTLIAHALKVEHTGQYFFALTYVTVFAVFADLGLTPVFTREASRQPEKAEEYLLTAFWTKVVAGGVAYALVVMAANILGYSAETKMLIYVAGLTMFCDNLHNILYGALRARQNLLYEGIGLVGSQVITLVLGSLSLFLKLPLYTLMLAYTIPSFLNFFYASYAVKRYYGLRYRMVWNRTIAREIIILAIPFFIAGFVGKLYAASDSFLMSKLIHPATVSERELGYWSVPFKIVAAFQFIPIALGTSMYPVISNLYIDNKNKIAELYEKAWRYLAFVGFPISCGLAALAVPFISHFYGVKYLPSVPLLYMLLGSMVLNFIIYINGAILNGIDRAKVQTIILTLGLVLNFSINVVLIPEWQSQGAALSALLSNALIFICGYYFVSRSVSVRHGHIIIITLKTLFPAIIMAFAVHFLASRVPYLLTIPIGAVIYAILLWVTGVIKMNDLGLLKKKFISRND